MNSQAFTLFICFALCANYMVPAIWADNSNNSGDQAQNTNISKPNNAITQNNKTDGSSTLSNQSLIAQQDSDQQDDEANNLVDDADGDANSSEPFASSGSTSFPCAPSDITSLDYSKWTDIQKIEFGVCFETNSTLVEEIKNRTVQMSPNHPCDEDVTWAHIRPGMNDVDYADEFHEEVLLPAEYTEDTESDVQHSPKSVRVVNGVGFKYIHHLMTSGKAVCDVLRNDHIPIQCRKPKCSCKELVPNEANDFITHFSNFRQRKQPSVKLEYNSHARTCVFPHSGECTVQPTENKPEGFKIQCYHENQNCVIKGNDVECTRRNMTRTIAKYNMWAKVVKKPIFPFRMHYPIDCICSSKPLLEQVPVLGFEQHIYREYFGLDPEADYAEFEDDDFYDEEEDEDNSFTVKPNSVVVVITAALSVLPYRFLSDGLQ